MHCTTIKVANIMFNYSHNSTVSRVERLYSMTYRKLLAATNPS